MNLLIINFHRVTTKITLYVYKNVEKKPFYSNPLMTKTLSNQESIEHNQKSLNKIKLPLFTKITKYKKKKNKSYS